MEKLKQKFLVLPIILVFSGNALAHHNLETERATLFDGLLHAMTHPVHLWILLTIVILVGFLRTSKN